MAMQITLNVNVLVKDGALVLTDHTGKTVTFSKEQTVQQKVSMIALGELCALLKRQLLGESLAPSPPALVFRPLTKALSGEGESLTGPSHYAPLPLRADSPGRAPHLAHPVHHLQSGLHRPAALRLTLPLNAPRRGP